MFLSYNHFNIIPHLRPLLPKTLDVKYKANLNSIYIYIYIYISTQHVEGHDSVKYVQSYGNPTKFLGPPVIVDLDAPLNLPF
jgi:hypothetical protein